MALSHKRNPDIARLVERLFRQASRVVGEFRFPAHFFHVDFVMGGKDFVTGGKRCAPFG
jgi:hypothetical protein